MRLRFPLKFAKFLRTVFFTEHLRWLLLSNAIQVVINFEEFPFQYQFCLFGKNLYIVQEIWATNINYAFHWNWLSLVENFITHMCNVILNKEESHTTVPVTNLILSVKKLFAVFKENKYLFINTVFNTISAMVLGQLLPRKIAPHVFF